MAGDPGGLHGREYEDFRNYLGSASAAARPTSSYSQAPPLPAVASWYPQTPGFQSAYAANVESTPSYLRPAQGTSSTPAPASRTFRPADITNIKVEEPVTDEQRALFMTPAFRAGSSTQAAPQSFIEELEHVSRLPAHLRPAAREALDVKRTEQASIKEATSVAAQIQELQRKRKEHLAAAERLRAQVAEVSGQEGVDALRSPDSSMPALAGRTEAELIEGLQLRRKSEAASRPSALPSRSQHDPFSDLPALPQPSVQRPRLLPERDQLARLGRQVRVTGPPSGPAARSIQRPPRTYPGISRAPPSELGLVAGGRSSIRPESSVSNGRADSSVYNGPTSPVHPESDVGIRAYSVRTPSVVSTQPDPKTPMREPREPEPRRDVPRTTAQQMAQHEYYYSLDRAHASRGLPCFCCE